MAHCNQLATARVPVKFLLPLGGCHEWDRPGADLHDADGLARFVDAMRQHCPDNVELVEIGAHINDKETHDAVLKIPDDWCSDGAINY